MYKQKDIVEVNFLFPDGSFKPHMAVIISNDEISEAEDFFYIALISSKNYNSKYTYKLNNDMLSKELSKQSYVICHIISGYTHRDVIRKVCKIKEPYFTEISTKIINSIF